MSEINSKRFQLPSIMFSFSILEVTNIRIDIRSYRKNLDLYRCKPNEEQQASGKMGLYRVIHLHLKAKISLIGILGYRWNNIYTRETPRVKEQVLRRTTFIFGENVIGWQTRNIEQMTFQIASLASRMVPQLIRETRALFIFKALQLTQ